jgi:hypothetical protein
MEMKCPADMDAHLDTSAHLAPQILEYHFVVTNRSDAPFRPGHDIAPRISAQPSLLVADNDCLHVGGSRNHHALSRGIRYCLTRGKNDRRSHEQAARQNVFRHFPRTPAVAASTFG